MPIPEQHSDHTKRPTLAQVAALAGVSHQTVSRVVNDFEGVRPATREKVYKAINQLGYRRNAAARALVTNESKLVGVIAVGSFLYGPVTTLSALEQAARRHGYMTLLATVRNVDKAHLDAAINQCLERSVDALIIIAARETWVRYTSTLELNVPIIVVGPRPSNLGSLVCVSVDQSAGAEMAVNHLAELGHRDVLLLAGPTGWVDAQERLVSAMATCNHHGINSTVIEGDWSAKCGHDVGLEILAMPERERPTAIFAANDQMALGLLSAFNMHGLSVPDEISVIGFDDVPDAGYYSPALTSVRQDFSTLGQRVLEACLAILSGNTPDTELVAPSLKVRGSTAAPRA